MALSDGILLNVQVEAMLALGDDPITRDPPQEVLDMLAKLRLLQDVPFNTLVPDTELLPHESIRFFFLDRAWTDALVQGALSVASTNTIERAALEAVYPDIEAKVDSREKQIRAPGSEVPVQGTAGLVTGFLMRSAAVAGWPGMHVRGYSIELAPEDDEDVIDVGEDHINRVKLLRLERLSPSVLLALFDGLPKMIHIEEPRQGLQFGIDRVKTATGRVEATVPARNVRTAIYVNGSGTETPLSRDAARIPVAFRKDAAGVLDLTNTAKNFRNAPGTNMGRAVDGAEFAMEMIRFPYRQVFAQSQASAPAINAAFKPTLAKVTEGYTTVFRNIIGGR